MVPKLRVRCQKPDEYYPCQRDDDPQPGLASGTALARTVGLKLELIVAGTTDGLEVSTCTRGVIGMCHGTTGARNIHLAAENRQYGACRLSTPARFYCELVACA